MADARVSHRKTKTLPVAGIEPERAARHGAEHDGYISCLILYLA